MNYIETLTKLRRTSGRNQKTTILKENKDDVTLQKILEYCYDPFKHYYINKVPWYGQGHLTLDKASNIWQVLDDLSTRTISGDLAKRVVESWFKLLSPEDAAILSCILKKDIKAGISAKTINAAWPEFIPIFGAMLAKSFDDYILGSGMYMSLKYDGLRGIFLNGKMYTRNGHEIKGIKHITDSLVLLGMHSADGELTVPGKHFQDVSGALRSFSNVPNAVYNVFDIPQHTGNFMDRYADLNIIVPASHPHIKVVRHIFTQDMNSVQRNYTKAIANGYEGLVLKTPKHKYQTKRSKDWLKMKEVKSVDLKVTDIFEGTGKYEKMAGGYYVDYKGKRVAVGSGLDDSERQLLWDDPDVYIGHTAEVLYHEVTKDGSLRHPRHHMWRIDK